MKLIDKKGRVFGRISFIDLTVIAVIIVLAIGAVYKFKFMDKTSNTVAMQDVTYTVRIDQVRDYIYDNIEIGDQIFDKASGNAIGTISGIQKEQATDIIMLSDGTAVRGPVENRINIILTIDAKAVKNDSGIFVNRSYELLRGSKRLFITKYFECEGSISSIEE